MAMDFRRNGQLSTMRTFVDGPPVPIVWYRVPQTTPIYPGPTPFRTRFYGGQLTDWSGIGEQVETCPPGHFKCFKAYNGPPPFPGHGDHVCGDAETWENGGIEGFTPPIVTSPRGSAPCCDTRILYAWGGQKEGGTAAQTRNERQNASGGQKEGGTAPQFGGFHQTASGGQAEGGTAGQVVGFVQRASGGQGEGGAAPQDGRDIQQATGGQAEGGTADQWGGFLDQAQGGQAEGGAAPQYNGYLQLAGGGQKEGGVAGQSTGFRQQASGGQKEGGRAAQGGKNFQIASGGQKEGGRAPEGGTNFQIASGGQMEGGRAPQGTTGFQIASGGQKEGGRATQGAKNFQIASGGQKEGGTATQGGTVPGPGFRGGSGVSNQTGTFSFPKPTGVVSGDQLVMVLNCHGTVFFPTTPTGWTSQGTLFYSSTGFTVVFTKLAGASEPSSYSVTPPSGGTYSGAIGAYYGLNATFNTGSSNSGTSATATALSMSSGAGLNFYVLCYGIDANLTPGTPSGTTLDGIQQTSSGTVMLAHLTEPAFTASGNRASALGSSSQWAALPLGFGY